MLRFAKEVLKPVVGWGFDIFIEETPRYRRCYRDPVKLDRRIKEIARRLIPSTEVYIFGSVSPGQVYGWERYRCLDSYSKQLQQGGSRQIKSRDSALEIDAPIELHIATRREFENWYARFIGRDELIEV